MTLRGGRFKKKRKKRKSRKGGGLWGAMLNPFGAAVGGLVSGYRALGGKTHRSKLSGIASRFRPGSKRGSGRANFLPGVTWHRGSGMGFSGSGMEFHGSGLRNGRALPRRGGSGRRMI